MTLACDFRDLFTGRTDAYGIGAGRVIHATPTIEHYADHLAGEGTGLGIFPLRDDGTVLFGAIDLDEPNFELARALQQQAIPGTSWVERSRSGNAHIWVFFDEPTPAWAVRAVLRFALESLGRRDVEIFPKQDEIRREGGVGNYINLPYHGDDRPVILEYPIRGYTVGRFVSEAAGSRQDSGAWVRRARTIGASAPQEREAASEWGESPVLHACAAHILENRHENPLVPGHRAQVLFHVACQLLNWRDLKEADANRLVHELNAAGTVPAPEAEVERQFENARRGRYTSTGCDDPVMAPYVLSDCPIANGGAGA